MKQSELTAEIEAIAEQSYDQLTGDWHDWLEVARKYERKVPYQDRYDMRHTILIELARARARDNEPIPTLRAYRIASLMVALYWRQQGKYQVKVCIFSGMPTEPHCKGCRHKPAVGECSYLAIRPVESLYKEVEDSEGNSVKLIDTVADDHAIDLDLQIDASTWLLGCPMRLIEIAQKKVDGIPLDKKDQKYLERYRQKTQASLF